MGELSLKKQYNNLLNQCELVMSQSPAQFPLKHIFADGVYIREMFIPKGGWLTSKVHLTEYVFMLNSGILEITDGEETVRILAPYTGISKKGARKMALALEDCIFSSVHPNPDNCKDIPTLEAKLFKVFNNPLLKKLKK
jgi:hypothetical protein